MPTNPPHPRPASSRPATTQTQFPPCAESPDGLDLGASIITGFGGGNPLAVLALQLQLGIQVLHSACPLYGADGRELPTELDQRAEALFNELMDGT